MSRLKSTVSAARIGAAISKIYRNQMEHDPSDIDRAREIASSHDVVPVGILYRNESVPCYEEIRGAGAQRPPEMVRTGLEAEFDKFTVWPQEADPKPRQGAKRAARRMTTAG